LPHYPPSWGITVGEAGCVLKEKNRVLPHYPPSWGITVGEAGCVLKEKNRVLPHYPPSWGITVGEAGCVLKENKCFENATKEENNKYATNKNKKYVI
jgi:hypothetical protein